jgi:hypothetical protein
MNRGFGTLHAEVSPHAPAGPRRLLVLVLGWVMVLASAGLAAGSWWSFLASTWPWWFEPLFGATGWGNLTAVASVALGIAGALVLRRARTVAVNRGSSGRALRVGAILGWCGPAAMVLSYTAPLVLLFLSSGPD